MRVLVIGAQGQLGAELCNAFADAELHRADVDGPDHIVDIRDADAVHRLIADELKPDFVFNTAAAHDVPRCEREPEWAFAINATGAWNVAKACDEIGARMIHVSTDYVFGGDTARTRPYAEADLPAPLNIYGASKLAGEHLVAAYCANHIICRPAALYGAAPCRAKQGRNFVSLMLHLAATQPEVRVVTDEITTPTCTAPLAKQMRILAERAEPGLYHTTCAGHASWCDFAQAVFEITGTKANLLPAKSTDFQSTVRRPAYSVLENTHAARQGLDVMPDWREALCAYLKA